MSLRLRVVAAIAIALALSAMLGAALAGWHAKQSLREEFTATLASGRQSVERAYEDLPRSDHAQRDLKDLVATFDGNRHVSARLEDAAGRTQLASRQWRSAGSPDAPAWFANLLRSDVPPVALPTPLNDGRRVVLAPYWANDIGATWAQFLDLLTMLAATLAAGSALVWLTVGRALRPLTAYTAALGRIGSGDYGARVRAEGPKELARLGEGVNEMAVRLAAVQERNQALERQLLTLQDEERADLARDLHDEIGPHLFAVNVDAAMVGRLVEGGRGPEALAQVKAIQASVGHMQRLVRDILSRLRPTQLFELGLAAAIGDLVAFWRGRHPEIVFDVRLPDDDAEVGQTAQEAIYRVVQEGLNNAVRHGRPKRVAVVVSVGADGAVTARVSDDGAGAGPPSEGGFGLVGMRERVAAAHGQLTIERGQAGGGWSVTARLPALADAGSAA